MRSASTPTSSDRRWTCADIWSGQQRYAMIVLNQAITRDDVFRRAWSSCLVRICADGGANRLYDHIAPEERDSYLPDMIKGDLDSVRPEVKEYYADRGVTVKYDPDQYATDLMKCVTEVELLEQSRCVKIPILLMGGLSGRVDQTVHTMSILLKSRAQREIFVLNGESLTWVLDTGTHTINVDHQAMGQTCGLLPVGNRALVTTKGLKWNLDWETTLEGQLSTSNHLCPEEPAVHVATSAAILWTVELREPLPANCP